MAILIKNNYSDKNKQKQEFKLSKVFTAFSSLPRIMHLVFSTSSSLTTGMASISLLRGCTPAVSAIITKQVIDSVVYGINIHSINPIWLPVCLQLAIGLLDQFLSVSGSFTQELLQERVSNRLQLMILEKAKTLDLQFFEEPEFYDKLRHASGEANYKPVLMVSQTFDLVRSIITLASMLFLLLHLAWWLAIVALVVPIPSFIASARYGWIGYRRVLQQSPERRKMAYFNQIMTVDRYNKEIKLFNLGDFFIGQYRRLAEKFYKENKEILTCRSRISFLWRALSVGSNAGIYFYVTLQAVLGRISLGSLTLYTQSAIQVGQSFQGVLDGISNMYENNLFVNSLFEFLDYKPNIVSPTLPQSIITQPESKGLEIEFRNVSFTYPGKDPLTQATLKDVSFTIKTGEAIALVGRNGAGKTTLVKLLARLYDPDQGEIFVGGCNIKNYDLKELRECIGVIFQDYIDYYMSARENIGIGYIDEIENLALVISSARKSGAAAVIERLPDRYETMLGKWFDEGVQLSGGEWQKIALARAFMREVSILILDEPTSSLDAQAEYGVFRQFRTMTEGKTAIFISHRFSTVRLADRIFVLENGRIIETGSHQELMELGGCYAELFNIQAQAYK